MKRPRVIKNCIASEHQQANEQIIEFSHPNGGGLIAIRALEDGEIWVEVYSLDGPVRVNAPRESLVLGPPAHVVVQEGGASNEFYAHAFDTVVDANRYRVNAAKNGAYLTTEPVEMPDATDFDALAELLAKIGDIGMPDVPDDEVDETDQNPNALGAGFVGAI
ncbi:hypothetical protein OG563_26680 [Nocardia vinacea]|uniref:Uncharacterized protein n=1 Tax=Nocardia vinacea TaxID=96468 RepID=A0ABZ1YLM9_9NOCA|nr:hypothetical protein [Nocardia vinacea]